MPKQIATATVGGTGKEEDNAKHGETRLKRIEYNGFKKQAGKWPETVGDEGTFYWNPRFKTAS
jgi:hypothetical protein